MPFQRVAVVFQSLPGNLSSNFRALGLRWWRILTCISRSDGPSFSRMFAWRNATLVNRTRRTGPNTLFALPRNRCRIRRLSVLWYTTQRSYTYQNSNCTFAFRLFLLLVWFFFSRTYIPISFYRTDIREDANTHMAILCKYLSRSTHTAVDWISQTGFSASGISFSRHAPTSCLQRYWDLFIPLVTYTFSSFNAN